MVQYLCEYGHKEKDSAPPSTGPRIIGPGDQKETIRMTHNIILEYGESDLEEYFAETTPPYLQAEVEAFWRGLFAVADAVRSIHNWKSKTEGKVQEYHGLVLA